MNHQGFVLISLTPHSQTVFHSPFSTFHGCQLPQSTGSRGLLFDHIFSKIYHVFAAQVRHVSWKRQPEIRLYSQSTGQANVVDLNHCM